MNDNNDLLDHNLEPILTSRISSYIDPNAGTPPPVNVQQVGGALAGGNAQSGDIERGLFKQGSIIPGIKEALTPEPGKEDESFHTAKDIGRAAVKTAVGLIPASAGEAAETFAPVGKIAAVAGPAIGLAGKALRFLKGGEEVVGAVAKVAPKVEEASVAAQSLEEIHNSALQKLDNHFASGGEIAPDYTPAELESIKPLMPAAREVGTILHDAIGESGGVPTGALIIGTRALIGGMAGGTVGASNLGGEGNTYDTVRDTLIGAGLGAIAGPATIKKLLPVLKNAEAAVAVTNRPTFKIPIGEGEVGINLNKLDSPERIQAALEKVKAAHKEAGVVEGLAPGSRGVVTDDMAATLGQQLGLSADDVMARVAGSAHPVEDVFAYSALLNNHYTQRLVPLASQVAAGSETAVAEMQKALAEYRLMGHQFAGVGEESGRSLRAFGLPEVAGVKSTAGKVGDIAELAEQTKVIPPQVLATAILEAGKTPAILQAFNQTEKLGFNWPTFTKVLYANLLSSPATHLANIMGNTVASALETGERFIAEKLFAKAADGRIGLNEIGVQKGEAVAMVHAFASTVLDGLKFTASSLKDGDLGRIIEALPSQAGAKGITGVDGPGAIQSFSDVLAAGLAVPTKLLGIEDGIARALNQNAAVRAYAVRQGVNLGKVGADLDEFVNKVVANPPTNIMRQAEADALKSTFNNPSPEWLQGIEKLTGDYPVLKVILPFIRTPYNLANYAVQRIPGANYALSAEYRADLAAGGARRQLAISKNISGSMIAGTVGYLALQGKVTGAGPDNADLRKVWLENHQPYSISVGGKWYSYNRLDPVAMLIGTTADITSQMMGMRDKDAAYVAEVVGLAFARNIASKTWFKSASDFLDLFNPKQSDSTDTFGKRVSAWGGNLAAEAIPFSAGVGAINRAFFDSTARQTADALDKVKAKLPYFSKTLPPKLTYFGEPIVYDSAGPDVISPIYTMDVKKNQVVSEIVKNRAPVPRIPTTGPSGDALTAQEIHDLIVTMNRPEEFDKSLHDALAEAIASPEYKSLPGPEVTNEGKPSGRGAYLAEITRGYYNQAISELANKQNPMDPDNHFSTIKKDSDESRRMTGQPIVPPTTQKGLLDNFLPQPKQASGDPATPFR